MQGLLLFYKPIDWRNKNILYFFQKTFGKDIKVGHSGTLDPFAEGLMVMGLGRKFTKQLNDLLLHSQKEYIAKIEFGKTSDTYDITGKITEFQPEVQPRGIFEVEPLNINMGKRGKPTPTLSEIKKVIEQEFLGEKIQTPPLYSAKKHKGKRLRNLAFASANGKQMSTEEIKAILESKKKNVTLYDFEIISYEYPFLEIRLLVSSGYYIRSFGNDLGEKLNTGAYLTELKRTKLGKFSVENALFHEDFSSSHSELVEESLPLSLRGTKQSQFLSPEPVEGQKSIELRGEIFGTVQGVGFRYSTKQLADKLTISGYSKNTENNSVEFLGQGNLTSIEKFQTEILNPPAPVEISDYQFIIQKPSQIYKNFEIL